ncbi:MAG: tetratricopeptide repeat-containing sensor histidine kinase [Cyclobacteriaceae bacterium]
MIKYTVLLNLYLSTLFAFSQEQSVALDSLIYELKVRESDSVKMDVLQEFYTILSNEEPSSKKNWIKRIEQILDNTPSKSVRAYGYSILGDCTYDNGKYVVSKLYYEKAAELNLSLGDSIDYGNSLFNLALTYDGLGDYISALNNYHLSLNISEFYDDKQGMADIFGNIAVLYSNQLDYENSIRYFRKSLTMNEEIGSAEGMSLDMGNLGAVYQDFGIQEKNPTMLNLAMENYTTALELQKEVKDENMIGWIKANMGLLFSEQKDYDKALLWLDEALKIARKQKDKLAEATALGNLSDVYMNMGGYQKALEYQQMSYQLALIANDKITLLGAYDGFAQIYEKLGNYKMAYEYQGKLKSAQDSLYNTEKNAKFNELISLYDIEKKEQEIKNLQQNKELQEARLEREKTQKNLTIVVALSFAVLALVIGYFYINQNKNRKELIRINSQLVESQSQLSKLNETKDRFFAIIAHDLRGAITSFQGIGQVIKNHLEKNRLERITMVADRIDNSARQLNGLLDNLLNWAVTQLGSVPFNPRKMQLKKVVDHTVDIFSETSQAKNIELTAEVPANIYVHADQNGLSVVLRNIVNNAFKFTDEGGRIFISAERQNGMTWINVADTGVGIPKDKLDWIFSLNEKKSTAGISGEKGTGLGLVLCKEFITLHKGEIKAQSEEGKGSTFTFSIPNSDTES